MYTILALLVFAAMAIPSVGSAVLRAGGVIRFCEVRERDLNVDLEHARSLIGPATRAVVITHYAGHPQDIAGLPVPVVEDAAHAFGSEIDGRPCGTLGRFGCLPLLAGAATHSRRNDCDEEQCRFRIHRFFCFFIFLCSLCFAIRPDGTSSAHDDDTSINRG
jgi:hypothetical protein